MSKNSKKEGIAISATKEEWEAVQQIITSYRHQSKTLKRYSPMLDLLNSFQRRLTEVTRWKNPDDYLI